MTLSFSRALAVVVGIITLLSEVVRRKQQLLDPAAFPLWIDDVLLGGFLLYGAWRVAADPQSGRPVLAAAWGFACGLAFYSFTGELQRRAGAGGLVPWWVMAVKAIGLFLSVVGLVTALRATRSPGGAGRQ